MLKVPEYCDKYLITKQDGNLKSGVFSKRYADTAATSALVFIPFKLLGL